MFVANDKPNKKRLLRGTHSGVDGAARAVRPEIAGERDFISSVNHPQVVTLSSNQPNARMPLSFSD